jgi:hypothetical protein
VPANNVLKRFFWCAFAIFLLASIPHVAYFFRAFEPGDTSLWWWLVAYAIAISVDITIFLLSLTVAELRRRDVDTWLVVSVWVFIVGLAALSWYINWQYAVQFASNMLSKPSSYRYVGMINPVIASCFQALAIAYTWISDKIAQADVNVQPAQPIAQAVQVDSVQIESVQEVNTPKQIAQRSVCSDEQIAQIAQLHSDGLSVRKIAQQVGVSPSTVQNKLKENV